MTIRSKEELEQILKEVDQADYSVADIKKGERIKRPRFLYHQHAPAGSIQSAEFCHFKDDEDCPAAL